MDIPESTILPNGHQRSTSTSAASAETKTLLEKLLVDKNASTEEEMGVYLSSQRGSSSDRVESKAVPLQESKAAPLQESSSDVENELKEIQKIVKQYRAGASSSSEALRDCIKDESKMKNLIAECSKIIRNYETIEKELVRAMKASDEEERVNVDLAEEVKAQMVVSGILREILRAIGDEATALIKETQALHEENKGLQREIARESRHR